jgi:Ca2+-transporting ATPase
MDGAPAQSLGVEPADPEVLSQPPRKKNTQILTKELLTKVAIAATTIFSTTMWVHLLAQADIIPPSPEHLASRSVAANNTHAAVNGSHTANNTLSTIDAAAVTEGNAFANPDSRDVTMTFTTFVLSSLFFSFACRSDNKSVFRIGIFSNRPLCWSLGLCVLGQLMVVYIPLLQSVFQTAPLSVGDLCFIVAVSSIILWVEEARKWFFADKVSEAVRSEKHHSFAEKDLDLPLLSRDEMA